MKPNRCLHFHSLWHCEKGCVWIQRRQPPCSSRVASWACVLASSQCLSSKDEGANRIFLANWLQFVHVLLPSHCALISTFWGMLLALWLPVPNMKRDYVLCVVCILVLAGVYLFFLFISFLLCLLPSLCLSFPAVLYGGEHECLVNMLMHLQLIFNHLVYLPVGSFFRQMVAAPDQLLLRV